MWTANGDQLSPISPNRLIGLNLSKEICDFLETAGLPQDASPFLSFIKDIDDRFEGINKLTDQYNFLEPEFDKYIVIGSDGSGNVIVINKEIDQIELLDHEDNFSSILMNSSIDKLADFLIIYRDFIKIIIHENGEDAFLNSDFTDKQFSELKEKMELSDKKALDENTFWNEELNTLQANRKYFIKNG